MQIFSRVCVWGGGGGGGAGIQLQTILARQSFTTITKSVHWKIEGSGPLPPPTPSASAQEDQAHKAPFCSNRLCNGAPCTAVGTHIAPYAYNSGRSSMRTLPPYTAPTRAVYIYAYPTSYSVGMVHMILSGSSMGTHAAPDEIFKLTYIQSLRPFNDYILVHTSFCTHVIITPAYEVCMVYSFRRFNHHICMRLF